MVQLQRIQGKTQNRLEKLLSVFEQKYFADDNGIIKEYNYPIDDEVIRAMIDLLHHAGTDPQQKKKIEDEQEAYRIMDLAVQEKADELKAEIAKNKKELEEKDKALAEMAQQREELKRRLGGQ